MTPDALAGLREVIDDDEFWGDTDAMAAGAWDYVVGHLIAAAAEERELARRDVFERPGNQAAQLTFMRCCHLVAWLTGRSSASSPPAPAVPGTIDGPDISTVDSNKEPA